jgi:hypothetical protein
LLKKITAVGIALAPNRSIWLSDELWDKMQVAYLRQGLRHYSKAAVRINLLQVCLGESTRVFVVKFVRTVHDDLSIPSHSFPTHFGYSLVILRELEPVAPSAVIVQIHFDVHGDVGITPSMKRSNLRHSAASRHRRLKTTFRIGDIS